VHLAVKGFEAKEMPEMMKMPLAFSKDTIRPEDITPFRCRIFGCKNLCCLTVKDQAEAFVV